MADMEDDEDIEQNQPDSNENDHQPQEDSADESANQDLSGQGNQKSGLSNLMKNDTADASAQQNVSNPLVIQE